MLAMNYRGPFRVRADQKPYPEILHPNDAIVRVDHVSAVQICTCIMELFLTPGLE